MINDIAIIQRLDERGITNNPVLLSALTTARALLQRRMTATTDSEHARVVKSLDAFMGNLQTADPDMADRIRRALYEQVTGVTQSMIDSEIMPELAEVE